MYKFFDYDTIALHDSTITMPSTKYLVFCCMMLSFYNCCLFDLCRCDTDRIYQVRLFICCITRRIQLRAARRSPTKSIQRCMYKINPALCVYDVVFLQLPPDLCRCDIHDRNPIPSRRLFICCITRIQLRAARRSPTKSIQRCIVLADVIFFYAMYKFFDYDTIIHDTTMPSTKCCI